MGGGDGGDDGEVAAAVDHPEEHPRQRESWAIEAAREKKRIRNGWNRAFANTS